MVSTLIWGQLLFETFKGLSPFSLSLLEKIDDFGGIFSYRNDHVAKFDENAKQSAGRIK